MLSKLDGMLVQEGSEIRTVTAELAEVVARMLASHSGVREGPSGPPSLELEMDELQALRTWNEANGAPFSESTLDGIADWVKEGAHAAGPPGRNRRATGDELVAELAETFYDLTPEQAASLASVVELLK